MKTMQIDYEKPEFVEIKMDAEIGSYQADYLEAPEPEEATSAEG